MAIITAKFIYNSVDIIAKFNFYIIFEEKSIEKNHRIRHQ